MGSFDCPQCGAWVPIEDGSSSSSFPFRHENSHAFTKAVIFNSRHAVFDSFAHSHGSLRQSVFVQIFQALQGKPIIRMLSISKFAFLLSRPYWLHSGTFYWRYHQNQDLLLALGRLPSHKCHRCHRVDCPSQYLPHNKGICAALVNKNWTQN